MGKRTLNKKDSVALTKKQGKQGLCEVCSVCLHGESETGGRGDWCRVPVPGGCSVELAAGLKSGGAQCETAAQQAPAWRLERQLGG